MPAVIALRSEWLNNSETMGGKAACAMQGRPGGMFVSTQNAASPEDASLRGPVRRSPRDIGGGLLLVALGLFGLYNSWGLTTGTPRQLGPGMVPQSLSVLLAIVGVVLAVTGFFAAGPALERWRLRGPLFILGAAVVFGLVIKPLGLLLAAPLAIAIGGLASPATRAIEIVIFGVVMTAFCVGLFKYALALPIPLAPWLIGY
jgi:putative tricarboxylic transport membrane protein